MRDLSIWSRDRTLYARPQGRNLMSRPRRVGSGGV